MPETTTRVIEIPTELAAEVAEHPERFRPDVEPGQPVLVLDVGDWPDDDEQALAVAGRVYPARRIQNQDGEHGDGWLSVVVNGGRLGYIISAWALVDRTPEPGERVLILEGEQAGRLATVNPPPIKMAGGGERLTITEQVDVERHAVLPPKVLTAHEEYQQIVAFDGLPVPEGLPAVARLLVKHVGDAAADSGRRLDDRQVFATLEEAGEFHRKVKRWDLAGAAEEAADLLITLHILYVVLDMPAPEGVGAGTPVDPLDVQSLATRFVKSYRQWQGMARRRGTREDAEYRLDAVTVGLMVACETLNIDLIAAVRAKLEVIFTRGWREPEVTRG